MTNKKDALIILLVIILASFFGYGNFIHQYLVSSNNDIKSNLISKKDSVSISYNKHINSTKTIERLNTENRLQEIEIATLKNNLKEYKRDYNETDFIYKSKNNKYKFIKTKPISYVKFNNPNQVYIDTNISDTKIRAMVYQEYVAGIVQKADSNDVVAYFSGDSKCSYAVFIGKDKISAIIENSKNNLLKAKYIPLWQDINIGDEVISSGLDGYFYEGYKVGVVVDINSHETYKVAFVKPYIILNNKKNFMIIDRKSN